jgi:hypothetical protein
MFTLNFSQPFKTDQNLTALFQTISKAVGGSGSSNNLAPNYQDGALMGNSAEFYMYGGLMRKTDELSDPYPDAVLGYQAYKDPPNSAQIFRPGFVQHRLPSGMTRYLAYGGAANVPSENKAYYFSGLRSPTAGPIYTVTNNVSVNAVNASNYMMRLDLSLTGEWSNLTLPDYIKGRANPEVVWLPVGPQGILVVLGGVTYPEFVNTKFMSENPEASVCDPFFFLLWRLACVPSLIVKFRR